MWRWGNCTGFLKGFIKGGNGTYYIVCAECTSRGNQWNDEQQAIEAWNRRVGDED